MFSFFFFFFKQKTAYEIYQCDWSSDVCSSDLLEKRRNLWEKLAFSFATKTADLLEDIPEEEMFGSDRKSVV